MKKGLKFIIEDLLAEETPQTIFLSENMNLWDIWKCLSSEKLILGG